MASVPLASRYVYISYRLVEQVVKQHTAERGGRLRIEGLSIGPKYAAAEVGWADGLPDNAFDLAAKATEASADLTGTLDAPGRFVRQVVDLEWWDLKSKDDAYRVAWMVARPLDGTNTMLCLCGSIDNYLGYQPPSDIRAAGWRPSSLHGMREIAQAFNFNPAHVGEVVLPAPGEALDDLFREVGIISMLVDRTDGDALGAQPMELMAEVFDYEDNVDLDAPKFGSVTVDRILIGAPLWVRTPPPEPLASTRGRQEG
jgi:hypothetical protein